MARSRMLRPCSTLRLIIRRAVASGTTITGNSFIPSSVPAWNRCWPSMTTYFPSRSTAISAERKPSRSIEAVSALRCAGRALRWCPITSISDAFATVIATGCSLDRVLQLQSVGHWLSSVSSAGGRRVTPMRRRAPATPPVPP